MNISIFSASNISVLNFKRKKTCLMGKWIWNDYNHYHQNGPSLSLLDSRLNDFCLLYFKPLCKHILEWRTFFFTIKVPVNQNDIVFILVVYGFYSRFQSCLFLVCFTDIRYQKTLRNKLYYNNLQPLTPRPINLTHNPITMDGKDNSPEGRAPPPPPPQLVNLTPYLITMDCK